MSNSAAGERRTGILLLLATAAIWGVNWPVMKFALSEMPPFAFRGYAGIAGAALAFGAARAAGERARLPAGQAPRLVLLALLNITSWMALNTEALLWLPASEAVILAYTMPIWSALLAWPVLGERPSLARTGGLLIGMLGCVVLVAGQPLRAARGQWLGIASALGAAVLFALGAVLSKRLPLRLPPITGVAWLVLVGTAPLLAASALFENVDFSRVRPLGWAAIGYNSILVICVSYITWFAALRRLPASTATVGTLLVPALGVFSATLLLGETLGPRQLGALALTLCGIALAARG